MVDDIRANKRYSCHHFHTHVYFIIYHRFIHTIWKYFKKRVVQKMVNTSNTKRVGGGMVTAIDLLVECMSVVPLSYIDFYI